MVKACTKCGEEKATTEFHKKNTGKYGVSGTCKVCISEIDREYRSRPEVKKRERKYNRSPERRKYVREYAQRPEERERKREYSREYRNKLENKQRQREYDREHGFEYRQRPEVRERKSEYNRMYSKMALRDPRHIEIAAKYATRSRDPWSDAEIESLMSSELPLVDIALELGRTYPSVQLKRNKMHKQLEAQQ